MEGTTMQYMLLLYGNEAVEAAKPKAQIEAEMAEYFALDAKAPAMGLKMVAGEALHPTTTATTVRIRAGKALTSDGPFAETKEHLGGFYIVESKNVDEALAFASHIPAARDGSIEVRELVDLSTLGA
jgi:hypothetical protein